MTRYRFSRLLPFLAGLICLLPNIFLSQIKQSKTEIYLSTLESKTSEFQTQYAKNSSVSVAGNTALSDLKRFAKEKYEATEENQFAIHNYLVKKSNEIDNQSQKVTQALVKPGFVESELLTKAKEQLSNLVHGLLIVPYFLEVRVMDCQTVVPDSPQLIHASTSVIKGVVLDVFKGQSRFKIKDTVQFYFYHFWHNKINEFRADGIYFVPLDIRGGDEFNMNDPLALVPYLDDSNGYYPIMDGEISDLNNFFGAGIKCSYKSFREELARQIQTIKSW